MKNRFIATGKQICGTHINAVTQAVARAFRHDFSEVMLIVDLKINGVADMNITGDFSSNSGVFLMSIYIIDPVITRNSTNRNRRVCAVISGDIV
ncbi:hypothetical protein D3C75_468190 [compost metagenome]